MWGVPFTKTYLSTTQTYPPFGDHYKKSCKDKPSRLKDLTEHRHTQTYYSLERKNLKQAKTCLKFILV